LTSIAIKKAITTSNTPIYRVSGHHRDQNGRQCEHQAEQGGHIFTENNNELTGTAFTKPLAQASTMPLLVYFAHTTPQGDGLGNDGKNQHTDCDHGLLDRLRVQVFVHTFVNRKHATHAEQDDRHQERPEIDTLAKTQWVVIVRGASCLAQSQQQKKLVSGICQRVNGFRQHRTGAGNEGGNTFRHGDRKIGAKCKKYRLD
jgi:hypothetical protein